MPFLFFHFLGTVFCVSSSNVANAFILSSVEMSRYRIVVSNCSCPRRKLTCTTLIPSSSQWDAFAWRKWGAPHFRHSKAVHMLEAGVPLIYIRNFLGHESVQTTEIYLRIQQGSVSKILKERKAEQVYRLHLNNRIQKIRIFPISFRMQDK